MWTNTTQQLVQGVMRHGPDILEHCQTSDDLTQYISRLHQEHLNYPIPPQQVDTTNWFIPYEYKTMDILDWLYQRCPTPEVRANNVVWGVGRGSSVASYVLFIIGVHKIDSVKYKLPINEFFKGE